ncbi:MAG: hypothetical protein GXO79_15755 [Chlorobi bacterium]|nr:hypothetical protein [Chlorobiota bacterium]
MASFIAFEDSVEVNGETILSVVHAMAGFETIALQLFKKQGLVDIAPGKWYSQQSWLNVFKEIKDKLGDKTLLVIGKAIPENANFPTKIDTLEKALKSINIAYHMNHRGGEIGYYKLIFYSEKDKKAIMECKNPYPSHFDRGIITSMARKFKPNSAITINVELDTNKPSRLKGDDSCTYIIDWSKKIKRY